jgi:hypothetical protein
MREHEQQIVERLFHLLPPGWRNLTLELRAIGRYTECSATVAPLIGERVPWEPPPDVLDKVLDARNADYRDGAWLGLWLSLDFPLEASFAYNYQQEPAWTGTPPPRAFAEELEVFPRSQVPEWLRLAAAAAPPLDETGWPLDGEPPLALFTARHLAMLPAGSELDRFGTPAGNLCFRAGTGYSQRSLPPDQLASAYHRYRVTRQIEVLAGTAVPWFGQPGGGIGYYLSGSIAGLTADGTLTEVRHVTGGAPWPEDSGTGQQDWPLLPMPTEPPLSLFTEPTLIDLQTGTRVEHYGGPDGNLVYVAGTAFSATSLPPSWQSRDRMRLEVTRPVRVIAGTAVPWFDQPGGGAGYYLPMAILGLLSDGSLVEV